MRGVTWHAKAKKWMARASINGKPTYLGLFCSQDEAEQAYLKATQATSEVDDDEAWLAAMDAEDAARRGATAVTTPLVKGYFWHAPSKKWRARITFNGIRRDLGAFETEADAASAYKSARFMRELAYAYRRAQAGVEK